MNVNKKINPEWVAFVLPFINGCPFFKNQNMKIINLEYGKAHLEVDIERKHLQAYGSVHGGVYAGLIDAAAWWAVYTQVEGYKNAFTAEMKLNYLASSNSGKFLAEGNCIKLGKTLGLGEATIKNENGKLLAYGTVTVMVTDPFDYPGIEKVPTKHL
ncbi:MAG: PaaI family thioesterase [Promethearchaeota archaeon]